jgi:hypothetical protein
MPVIPATQEAEVGGSQSKFAPGKIERPYLKNKLKQKELGVWLKWLNAEFKQCSTTEKYPFYKESSWAKVSQGCVMEALRE